MGSWETCLRPDSLDHRAPAMNNTIRQLVRLAANNSKCYKSTWSEPATGILSKKSSCQLESARAVQANAGFPNLYQSAATNLAPGKIGLVDDLLDFVSSADQLGKPAAADMKLGLATAPVLFASQQFPVLNDMIARRFSQPGDVEEAFQCVIESGGLDRTRALAKQHCEDAIAALDIIANSNYKYA